MIPHITKGGDMHGLLGYLVSTESRDDPRANQHEHPRVVAGDPFVAMVYDGQELDAEQGQQIAAYLDRPRATFGTRVTVRRWQQTDQGERVAVLDEKGHQATGETHVWHCSLSLADGETLSDAQWRDVAQEFGDGMGFTGADGHAPSRWVALHHGAGRGGHDHLHLAVSVVRQDGTRWSDFRDWSRAQTACRDLERKHGLVEVRGAEHGTATRGATPAELGHQQRHGLPVLARDDVAQRVRAAAVASASEAEWVRRVRSDGVVLKPRFAPGTTGVVVGYRAALKNQDDLRFYGGGQLGRDLSLPRLRELWREPSVEQAESAAAEWRAAHVGQPPTRAGREAAPLTSTAPEVARQNLAAYADRLAQVPATDRVAWSLAAREVSGALAAWSQVDETNREALRHAAGVIGRTAQDRRAGAGPALRSKDSAVAATLVLMASRGDKPAVAAAALMAQLMRTAAAIRDAQREVGNLREARAVNATMRTLTQLEWVGYAPEPASGKLAATQQPAATRPHVGAKTRERNQDGGR